MPRHVINLQPDTYAFDDQPLIHEGIWKAASAIAQAPMQMAQLRMQQDDRASEQEMRALQMQNLREEMAARPLAVEAAAAERKYQHDKDTTAQRNLMTTKAADQANKARELAIKEREAGVKEKVALTPTQQALKMQEGKLGIVPDEWATERDRSAEVNNREQIKAQGLGQFGLTMNAALTQTPKLDARGRAIDPTARLKDAEALRQASYKKTLGENLISDEKGNPVDLGAPPSLKMAMEPEAPDFGDTPGLGATPLADAEAVRLREAEPRDVEYKARHVQMRLEQNPATMFQQLDAIKETMPDVYEHLLKVNGIVVPPKPVAPVAPVLPKRGLTPSLGLYG